MLSQAYYRDEYYRKKFADDEIDHLHGSQWGHEEDAYETYERLCEYRDPDIVIATEMVKVCQHTSTLRRLSLQPPLPTLGILPSNFWVLSPQEWLQLVGEFGAESPDEGLLSLEEYSRSLACGDKVEVQVTSAQITSHHPPPTLAWQLGHWASPPSIQMMFDVTCMGGFENYSHTRACGECHPAVLSSVHIRCTDLEMACQSEVSRVTVAIRVAILNGYILDSTTILDSFQDSYQNSYHSRL